MNSLLDIKGLTVNYITDSGRAEVLDNVDFSLEKGTIDGLIGESGCGKSTLAKSVLGILPQSAELRCGEIVFENDNLLEMDQKVLNTVIRGKRIAFIPQDPMASLNPVFRIGTQILDIIMPSLEGQFSSRRNVKKCAKEKIIKEFERVQIGSAERILRRYPHELSGGQQQRILIAAALCVNPVLIIADEPTQALDVTIEAQILRLLNDLLESVGTSTLYITHDLAVASELCDYITVMYCGQIVESSPSKDFFSNPLHPYSKKLLACLPDPEKVLSGIPGGVPTLVNPPKGCRFHPRCERMIEECSEIRPPQRELSTGHFVSCNNPILKSSPVKDTGEVSLCDNREC